MAFRRGRELPSDISELARDKSRQLSMFYKYVELLAFPEKNPPKRSFEILREVYRHSFLNALQRGWGPVKSDLETVGVRGKELIGGRLEGVKVVSLRGDKLFWRREPMNSGPYFENNFENQLRNLGEEISGTTTFEEEPIILDQILEKGVEIQKGFYYRHVTAVQIIEDIKTNQDVEPYLNSLASIKSRFDAIQNAEAQVLEESRKLNIPPRDVFISKFVARQEPDNLTDRVLTYELTIPDTMADLVKMSEFYQIRGVKIAAATKEKFDRTMTVNLSNLTRGSKIEIGMLRSPLTDLQEVSRLEKRFFEMDPQARKEYINISLAHLSRSEKELRLLLEKENLPADLVIEYLHNTIRKVLKTLPSKSYLDNLPTDGQFLEALMIDWISLYRIPSAPALPLRYSEEQVGNIVKMAFREGKLNLDTYKKYNEESKVALFKAILEQPGNPKYEELVFDLISQLGIRFISETRTFSAIGPSVDSWQRQTWPKTGQRMFLELCKKELVTHQNNRLANILAATIMDNLLLNTARQQTAIFYSGQMLDKSIRRCLREIHFNSKIGEPLKSNRIKVHSNQLIKLATIFALSEVTNLTHGGNKKGKLKSVITEEFKQRAVEMAMKNMENTWSDIVRSASNVSGSLSPGPVDFGNIKILLENEIDVLVTRTKNVYFPEGDIFTAIKNILEKSTPELKSLSKRIVTRKI